MPHPHSTEAVRRRVAHTFAELGLAGTELSESILIRGGAYCGRRFDAGRGHAIWFVEEDQVKFYDDAGCLAAVISIAESRQLQRMAA
jgi:hypothetical protein